ncbi:hypothetical protein HDV05_005700, partial [Chytridiales sp. JEL 0842]
DLSILKHQNSSGASIVRDCAAHILTKFAKLKSPRLKSINKSYMRECPWQHCGDKIPDDDFLAHTDRHLAEDIAASELAAVESQASSEPSPHLGKRKQQDRDATLNGNNSKREALTAKEQVLAGNLDYSLPSFVPPKKSIIGQLQGLLKCIESGCRKNGSGYKAYLCNPTVEHYANGMYDLTWGCGYRNTQMLFSSLFQMDEYSTAFLPSITTKLSKINQTLEAKEMVSVRTIQSLIELAWEDGFDVDGATQLKYKLRGTKKWIGASVPPKRAHGLRPIYDYCSKAPPPLTMADDDNDSIRIPKRPRFFSGRIFAGRSASQPERPRPAEDEVVETDIVASQPRQSEQAIRIGHWELAQQAINSIVFKRLQQSRLNLQWGDPSLILRFFCPNSSSSDEAVESLLQLARNHLLVSADRAAAALGLVECTPQNNHQFIDEVCFYMRDYEFSKSGIEMLLENWEEDEFDPPFVTELRQVFQESERNPDTASAKYSIRYVGMAGNNSTPLDRFEEDLRRGGILGQVHSTIVALNLDPTIRVFAWQHRVSPMCSALVDHIEQALIAFFGHQRLINVQKGGYYGSWSPSSKQAKMFQSLKTSFFDRLFNNQTPAGNALKDELDDLGLPFKQYIKNHVGKAVIVSFAPSDWVEDPTGNGPPPGFFSIAIFAIHLGYDKYGPQHDELRDIMFKVLVLVVFLGDVALNLATKGLNRDEIVQKINEDFLCRRHLTGKYYTIIQAIEEAKDKYLRAVEAHESSRGIARDESFVVSEEARELRRNKLNSRLQLCEQAVGHPGSEERMSQVARLWNMNIPDMRLHLGQNCTKARFGAWASNVNEGKFYLAVSIGLCNTEESNWKRIMNSVPRPEGVVGDDWKNDPIHRERALKIVSDRLKAGLRPDHFSSENQRRRRLNRWKSLNYVRDVENIPCTVSLTSPLYIRWAEPLPNGRANNHTMRIIIPAPALRIIPSSAQGISVKPRFDLDGIRITHDGQVMRMADGTAILYSPKSMLVMPQGASLYKMWKDRITANYPVEGRSVIENLEQGPTSLHELPAFFSGGIFQISKNAEDFRRHVEYLVKNGFGRSTPLFLVYVAIQDDPLIANGGWFHSGLPTSPIPEKLRKNKANMPLITARNTDVTRDIQSIWSVFDRLYLHCVSSRIS